MLEVFRKADDPKKTIKYLYLKKGNYIFKDFENNNYHKIMTWLSQPEITREYKCVTFIFTHSKKKT